MLVVIFPKNGFDAAGRTIIKVLYANSVQDPAAMATASRPSIGENQARSSQ